MIRGVIVYQIICLIKAFYILPYINKSKIHHEEKENQIDKELHYNIHLLRNERIRCVYKKRWNNELDKRHQKDEIEKKHERIVEAIQQKLKEALIFKTRVTTYNEKVSKNIKNHLNKYNINIAFKISSNLDKYIKNSESTIDKNKKSVSSVGRNLKKKLFTQTRTRKDFN